MKFDKHGIANVYKEPSRGISLGLISEFEYYDPSYKWIQGYRNMVMLDEISLLTVQEHRALLDILHHARITPAQHITIIGDAHMGKSSTTCKCRL